MSIKGKIGSGLMSSAFRVVMPIFSREEVTEATRSGNSGNQREVTRKYKKSSAVGGFVRGAVGDTLFDWGYKLKRGEVSGSVSRDENNVANDVYRFYNDLRGRG